MSSTPPHQSRLESESESLPDHNSSEVTPNSPDAVTQPEKISTPSRNLSRYIPLLSRTGKAVRLHFLKHVGAGLVASVAYFDPGNWSVDLQAGSQYGYKLLFVVLLSGIFAVILQVRRSLSHSFPAGMEGNLGIHTVSFVFRH